MSCFELELVFESDCCAGMLQADGETSARSIPIRVAEMESLMFMRVGIPEERAELADASGSG